MLSSIHFISQSIIKVHAISKEVSLKIKWGVMMEEVYTSQNPTPLNVVKV